MKTIFILLLTGILVNSNLNALHADEKHKVTSLEEFHAKFLKIDVHSKELNLTKTIKDVKKAREIYPLDSKLKTVDMELENREANEVYILKSK